MVIYKGFQKENVTTVIQAILLCSKVQQWSSHHKQKSIALAPFLCSESGQLSVVLQKHPCYEFWAKDKEPLKVSKADIKNVLKDIKENL